MKQLTLLLLKEMIRLLISNMVSLNEITSTDAGGNYLSPNCFGKKASSDILNR